MFLQTYLTRNKAKRSNFATKIVLETINVKKFIVQKILAK